MKLINKETARRAYSAISFTPDKRAEAEIKGFRETMENYLRIIKEIAPENWEKEFEKFNERAVSLYTNYLNAKSRTMSPMITGPARFPVASNRKKLGYEQSAFEKYRDFLERAIKAIRRSNTPKVDELEQAITKLENLETQHALMVEANKVVKRKIPDAEKDELLEALGIDAPGRDEIMRPKFSQYPGFATYQLQNSRQRIKAAKLRIEDLKARKALGDKTLFESSSLIVEINSGLERVMFFFDGKPAEDVRALLKKNAFKWSPKNQAWQRKTTANAIQVAKILISQIQEII